MESNARASMTELLIIKPSSLGDIVHGLQVATSLKAQRDGLRISWVVREMFAPIVRACEAVDRVYVFERNAGAKGFLRLMREVRATKFDYVFDMQGLLRTGLMTSRARAKHKVGRSDAREWAGMFYDAEGARCRPRAAGATPSTSSCSSARCSAPSPSCGAPSGSARWTASTSSLPTGGAGARPFVLFPDSRRPDKKWGGFKQLTEMILREDRSRKVVWAGSNLPAGQGRLPLGAVPQPDGQHEPGLAPRAREAGGMGGEQRQRAHAPGGRARRARVRDLRPERPAALRARIRSGGP